MIKKISALLAAVLLLLALSACGDFVSILPGTEYERSEPGDAGTTGEEPVFAERPLLTFLGLDAFGESYYSDTPVALSYQPVVDGSGTRGCRSYVFDRASIITACDALRETTVIGRTDREPAAGAEFILSMSDGTEHAFALGSLADGSYTLTTYTGSYLLRGGDAIWGIEFPAYSDSFDLFDLYFSSAIRRFADEFYENTPVSVGYRMASGATVTSEDPALIEQVFRVLDGATVTVVENYPDQNIDLTETKDYIFTMADGSYYTFSFAQQCLAVKAAAGFDTVYYWLGGISELWDIRIMSENNVGRFEGGAVSDLREDIRLTADIVSGANEELTVAGVFVEYDIDGQSGYLTLSEELALSFLREALSVSVSGSTVDAPAGSTITVSVTLSDLSGPILYFTGDSIQQVVGMSYACDSGDMTSLRSTILELAAEGNNTAEITEGTSD